MIRAFSLAEAASHIGSDVTGLSGQFVGVSTDTRTLAAGDLFVALRGDNFDGHAFLEQAAQAGAIAAVVDTVNPKVAIPQLKVNDTLQALGRLAAANRNESQARFVAVTGSSGKTTVKEMVAAILGGEASTLATLGNLNNHIGVPLTLLRVEANHHYAVIEHGASAVGEIAETVALTRPDIAIITNAGEAHLEGFGSYENIVKAKGELIDGVVDGGVVILNQDDPAYPAWCQRAGNRRVVSVSAQRQSGATFELMSLATSPKGQQFVVAGPDGWKCTVELALPGPHNVLNAMLAIAAAWALGVSSKRIVTGLAEMKPVKGRLNPTVLQDGLMLIDDSYNANPASIKAALGVLAEQPGVRIAVLGAMAELGPESDRLHQDVGKVAAELGIDQLVAVGDGSEGYCAGYGAGAEHCDSHDAAVTYLLKQDGRPMTVLVKGSRSSAMERVAEGLKQKVNDSCCSG